MSSTKSKAKTTNANSEEDQFSFKDLLERMDAMNLLHSPKQGREQGNRGEICSLRKEVHRFAGELVQIWNAKLGEASLRHRRKGGRCNKGC
jgi:hypothetical protein